MSIQAEIARLAAEQRLFCLESRLLGEETVRTVWVTREVHEAVTPPYAPDKAVRLSEFREFLDGFLEGGLFSVAEDPECKPSDAMIARVHPIDAQFWDFRVTAPRPGVRAFGAFGGYDTFVVLAWEFREAIPDFTAEVEACRAYWRELFGPVEPFKGNTLNDYLSNFYAV